MFCQKCGVALPEGAKACPQCGTPVRGPVVTVPNYMFLSLLMISCCCPPCALPALIASAQVNARAELGDIEGARRCSRTALIWNLVGLALVVVLAILSCFSIGAIVQTFDEVLKNCQQMQGGLQGI